MSEIVEVKIRVPSELHQRLQTEASKTLLPVCDYIVQVLKEHVNER